MKLFSKKKLKEIAPYASDKELEDYDEAEYQKLKKHLESLFPKRTR